MMGMSRIGRSGSNLDDGNVLLQGLSRTARSGYNPHSQGAVPKWLREQSAKLRCGGSNPPRASTPNLLSGELRSTVPRYAIPPVIFNRGRAGFLSSEKLPVPFFIH